MKLKMTTLALGAALAAGPAMAELVFPSLSYRTGPYAANGIPFADGYADYFTLLNERDGGIGGEPAITPKKVWNAMKAPRAKARWSISRCLLASPTS